MTQASSGRLARIAGLLYRWLTFLSPPLAASLSPYVFVSGAVGEGSLALWLLIKGIDVGSTPAAVALAAAKAS